MSREIMKWLEAVKKLKITATPAAAPALSSIFTSSQLYCTWVLTRNNRTKTAHVGKALSASQSRLPAKPVVNVKAPYIKVNIISMVAIISLHYPYYLCY